MPALSLEEGSALPPAGGSRQGSAPRGSPALLPPAVRGRCGAASSRCVPIRTVSQAPEGAQFSSVQSLSRVRLSVSPWAAARQASLSITNSRNLLKLMSIGSVMPSNQLILCRPFLLPPSIFPSIRVFSKESVLRIRCPKYWSFSFSRGTWEWPNPRRGLMRGQLPLSGESGESGGGPLLELYSNWLRKPQIPLV